MSADDNVITIHYNGVEYANLGEVPFPTVGFGDVLAFDFEIENKSSNSLGNIIFESNVKSLGDSVSGQIIQPFKSMMPEVIPPFSKKPASIEIDGTALFKLDSKITTITMGIRYEEQRVFRG